VTIQYLHVGDGPRRAEIFNRHRFQTIKTGSKKPPYTFTHSLPVFSTFYKPNNLTIVQVSYSGVETLNITSTGSLLYGTDPPRTCVPTNTNVYFPGQDIWTVSSLSSNGCRPRYSCVKFTAQGPSVLQVALSLVTVWPQPLPLDPTQICAASLFTDQPTTSTTPQVWTLLSALLIN